MVKSIIFISLLLLIQPAKSQTIDGFYTTLELNGLEIDSAGNIYFYGIDSFKTEKWFYEVSVAIRANQITIEKNPVFFKDSIKSYSASDGGFITYKGILTKLGDTYIAKTKMSDYDYVGFSFFEAPKLTDDFYTTFVDTPVVKEFPKETERMRVEKYDRIKKDGGYVYFPKGLLRQDLIIRPDKNGLWINNVFYRRSKQKINK